MKKLVFIAILFLSCQSIFAQKSSLSKAEIEEYSEQIKMMVKYLEETFSFIGNPETTAQEKDVIFKESYAKIFMNDEVQIEDDLDDRRSTYINKDVQAYLKDIDFFFKDITFTFKIDEIKPQANENGDTFFKVKMIRTIVGHNIAGDTVNNTCQRFMEINIDQSKKDLKIASIYTTKQNVTEELRIWWNRMPAAWKKYFGEKQYLPDSTEIKTIAHIYRDSIVVVDDNLAERTIACDMPKLYAKLTSFTKTTDIDISRNESIHTLEPLYELSGLQNLDCSFTDVDDISPIRNLNKINKLDIGNTAITNISDLRYTNEIKVLKADNLRLNDIGIIELYHQLTNLSLSNTDVEDISVFNDSELSNSLHYLNLSNTNISDLTPIGNLENLQSLIIDDTQVTDLSPLANLIKLNELQCRNTKVSDLMPLKDLTHLVRIFCDNTLIDSEKADKFRKENNNVMVIYETKALQDWWDGLPKIWKEVFATQNETDINPGPEDLHVIISMKKLKLDQRFADVKPVERLTNLESLTLNNTKVTDLAPLHGLHNLKYLHLTNTKIKDLTPLENISSMLKIFIENTQVSDLTPLCNMKNLRLVKADNSKVKTEQVLKLKSAVPNVTVLYQTKTLEKWWNTLDENWKNIFKNIVETDTNPKAEQLQAIADIEEINIDTRIVITSLEPLKTIIFLKKLSINDNHITDLSPLGDLRFLTELHIDGNAISDLFALADVTTLEVLSIENTSILDLNPLEKMANLKMLDISNTNIKNIKVLSQCTSLEELNIANTNIRSLAPVAELSSLKYIKAIGSKVKAKEINALRSSRPELNIIYH